ncbi:PilZ domain-containing protein [Candidatus Magnetaquiglobus chichijimensis]|uniref:PilZ domain-containing protein n=1 Tax=Candidatus Magnetaquiglobus chichijimensis TaxID=3141448 RepID=UPI003B96F2B3
MSRERRTHIRVAFSIKAAFHCRTGFLYNVPVVDISSGGIRMDIPISDQFLSCKDGVLKLFVQPQFLFNITPYVLEMPCRLAWFNDSGVGVEFINPETEIVDSIDDMITTASHRERCHSVPERAMSRI